MANIRTAGKSGFIRRSGGRVRETLWIGGAPFIVSLTAVNSVNLITNLNATALALRPFTVVRTRGQLNVRSDQAGASEAYGCSYGKAIVSEQAEAAGVASVPTPTLDSDSDLWFVYEMMLATIQLGTAVAFDGHAGVQRIVDAKAMRKVEDGQQLIGVVEGAGGAAGGGCIIAGFVRTLVKLH